MQVVATGLFGKYLRDALGTDKPQAVGTDVGRVLALKDFYAHFLVLTVGVSVSTTCFLTVRCVDWRNQSTTRKGINSPPDFSPDMNFSERKDSKKYTAAHLVNGRNRTSGSRRFAVIRDRNGGRILQYNTLFATI